MSAFATNLNAAVSAIAAGLAVHFVAIAIAAAAGLD